MIEDWTIPVCAFITFDTDDAKEDILKLVKFFSEELDENTSLSSEKEKIKSDFIIFGN